MTGRRKMIKNLKRNISLSLLSLFLTLSLGSVERVLACSCVPTSPCQNYQNADVVFFGKAVEMKQLSNNDYQTHFEVAEEFKNAKKEKRIKISSNSNEGICGYQFELNQTYLVFAKLGKKGYWTGSCYGNIHTDYAEKYLISCLEIRFKSPKATNIIAYGETIGLNK